MASVFCALALKRAFASTIATPLLTKLLRRPTKTTSSFLTRYTTSATRSFSSSSSSFSPELGAAVIIETDMDKNDYCTLWSVDENGLTYELTRDYSEMDAAVKAGMPYTQLFIVRHLGVVKLVKKHTFQKEEDGMKIKVTTVYENR